MLKVKPETTYNHISYFYAECSMVHWLYSSGAISALKTEDIRMYVGVSKGRSLTVVMHSILYSVQGKLFLGDDHNCAQRLAMSSSLSNSINRSKIL